MHSHTILAQLRDALAYLYDEQDAARVVVEDAGIDPLRVHFSDRAINNWRAILREAVKAERLDALIEVALDDYSVDTGLQAAAEAYRAYVAEHGPIRSTVPPVLEPFVGHTLLLWSVLVMGVLIAAVVGYRVWSTPPEEVAAAQPTLQPTATVTFTPMPTSTPGPTATPTLPFPTTAPDEYLIVVTEFKGANDEINPMIAISDGVEEMREQLDLEDVMDVQRYTESVIDTPIRAQQLGKQASANVVIWGTVSGTASEIYFQVMDRPSPLRETIYPSGPVTPSEYYWKLAGQFKRLSGYFSAFVLGEYWYEQKSYSEAADSLQRALDTAEGLQEDEESSVIGIEYLYLLLGNVHFAFSDWEQSLNHYSAALEQRRPPIEAYYNRALTYVQNRNIEDALTDLDELLKRDREYINAYLLKGILLSLADDEEDIQRAVEVFSQAIKLPDSTETETFLLYTDRGYAYLRLGDFTAAQKDLEYVLGAEHDCAPLFDEESSEMLLETMNTLCAGAANILAGVHTESGNYSSAIEVAQLAVEKSTRNTNLKAQALDTLATVYSEVGACDEARTAWEEAIQLNSPSTATFQQRLDELSETCVSFEFTG